MKTLHELHDILESEIKKVTRKGDITPAELEAMYKAVDIIKDITTIEAMKKAEEDEDGVWRSWHGNSYDEMPMHKDGAHSNRYYPPYMHTYDATADGMHEASNARGRDAKGRYTSRDMRYSRAEAKDKMIEKLERMMDSTTSAKDREVIRSCIEDLEKE